MQVSAYGSFSGSNNECKVEFWGSQDASVRCFNTNGGAPVDSYFDVLLGS